VDAASAESARNCILATKLPQRAVSQLEQIVCDADLFHLGTDEFGERNKLLRKEVEAFKGEKISKEEWRRSTIRLLEGHQYYTGYCKDLLSRKQRENLVALRHKEEEQQVGTDGGASGVKAGAAAAVGGGKAAAGTDKLENILHQHLQELEEEDDPPLAEAGKKAKKKDPGRSIDTVFRITSNNNQRLSSQADSKAHILIQVNAIIISVLLSVLLRKIEDHTNLAIPATLLLTVNLVTIIFSILATRPQIPPGRFTRADLDEKRVNLLFFGNFYRMSLEEYAGGMLQMMEDRDFLYGSLIRDVYFQGIALGRKFRWLRWSYNVFMYGLIVSVTAFMVAALAFPGK